MTEQNRTRKRLTVLAGLALAGAAGWAVPRWASAERDVHLLMSMDHHLVEADAVLHVRGLLPDDVASEEGATSRVEVLDVWFSRWGTEPGAVLDLPLGQPGTQIDAQNEYVLLLSGGPFVHSPLTHREHSFFEVRRDGTVRCGQGTTLFGVMSNGFLCSIEDLVEGAPITIAEMRAQFDRAHARAVERHPELSGRLDAERRPLLPRADVEAAEAGRVFR